MIRVKVQLTYRLVPCEIEVEASDQTNNNIYAVEAKVNSYSQKTLIAIVRSC